MNAKKTHKTLPVNNLDKLYGTTNLNYTVTKKSVQQIKTSLYMKLSVAD